MIQFDEHIFSDGLVQPPTSYCNYLYTVLPPSGVFFPKRRSARRFSQFLVNCTKRRFRAGHPAVSVWISGFITAWNPKQPFINGCFNWMIPNLYIGNGCFTKHPVLNGCLGFQVFLKRKIGQKGYLFREGVHIPPGESRKIIFKCLFW